jgi:hypothetical protein
LDPLDFSSLAALSISALLLTLLWARRRGDMAAKVPAEPLDTVQSWPPQAVRVLTLPERKAYDLLRRALPGRLVLAQVPLARFLSVPTRHSYSDWLTRVGRLSVDLLVCDHSSRVIAAIDIRTADESSRAQRRHARMAQVLKAAQIDVLSWHADALPSPSEVRTQFMRHGALDMPADAAAEAVPTGPGGKRMLPVAEILEVLNEGDEAAASASAPFDPVSSAYFDDLDAIPQSGTRR